MSTFKMLVTIILTLVCLSVINGEEKSNGKPYVVVPIPLDLPNRNERSTQCWLRIEDEDLTETMSILCHTAQSFLRNYIHDYNSDKMTEDVVDVSLWSEEPRKEDDLYNKPLESSQVGQLKDWRVTTIKDPITHMRLYVSLKADCRLILCTIEGMSNYRVNCEKLLYFVNSHINSAVPNRSQLGFVAFVLTLYFLFS